MIIAIDGPSGAGKSTAARMIAERLSLPYLDTGAMYRAVALVALNKGVDLNDSIVVSKIAAETKILMLDERKDGKLVPRVVVNGVDATPDIRTPEVTQGSSSIAVHTEVRDRLVRRQRNWVNERGGGVVEGRDIGTVVFPEAELKVFLTATDDERAKRRQADEYSPGFQGLSYDDITRENSERDTRDSTREASPLAAAADALVVDTSGQDIDEVVTNILIELRKRTGGQLPAGTER